MIRRSRRSALAVALALAACASAQLALPSSVTTDQLAQIDAAWVAAGFSAPIAGSQSLNVTLKSSALMSLAYGGAILPPGTAVEPAQVAAKPQIYLTPLADSSWTSTTKFVYILISAGPIGRKPVLEDYSHALSYNVQLTMPAPAAGVTANMSLPAATDVFLYTGPTPAIGSGPNRYAVIAAVQPDGFTMPAQYTKDTVQNRIFGGKKFFADTGLTPVAASWFSVQQGEAPSYASSIAVLSTLAAGAAVSTSTVSTLPTSIAADASSIASSPVLVVPISSDDIPASTDSGLVLPTASSSGMTAVPWGADPTLASTLIPSPSVSASGLSLINGSLVNASSGGASPSILPMSLPRGLVATCALVAFTALGSVLLL